MYSCRETDFKFQCIISFSQNCPKKCVFVIPNYQKAISLFLKVKKFDAEGVNQTFDNREEVK